MLINIVKTEHEISTGENRYFLVYVEYMEWKTLFLFSYFTENTQR